LARAIADSRPDLIIPCDDLATNILRLLHQYPHTELDRKIARLIENSLGDSVTQQIYSSRSEVIALAAGKKLPIADVCCTTSLDSLNRSIDVMGLPAVMKADGTSGGRGVRIVETAESAARAFRQLGAPPLFLRTVKRAVVDFDLTLVGPFLRRTRPLVNVQRAVFGPEMTATVATWKGEVVASLVFEVIHTSETRGPATVLALVQNSDVTSCTVTLARELSLSGIYGFDFIVDETSRRACLIEMNARATQTAHLGMGPGRDPAAALFSRISGVEVTERMQTDKKTIALFPGEWQRDPSSRFIATGYHDVPWDEPGLVRAGLSMSGHRRLQLGSWLTRKEWSVRHSR
jgi:hypothetical protein